MSFNNIMKKNVKKKTHTHMCVCVCLRERSKEQRNRKEGRKEEKTERVSPPNMSREKRLEKMRVRKPSIKLCKQKTYINSFFNDTK